MGKQDLDNTSADDNASIEDDDFDDDEEVEDVDQARCHSKRYATVS